MTSSTKTVHRLDRDLRPISTSADGDDNWQARIYRRAERRQHEAQHEAGLQSLRDRIGVPKPPQTLRERIMSRVETSKEPPRFDVVAELQKACEERERREKIRHPS